MNSMHSGQRDDWARHILVARPIAARGENRGSAMKVFWVKTVAGIVAITLLGPPLMMAGDSSMTSWQNLRQLAAGQEIEVTKTKERPVRGTFIRFADQSISLREKQQEIEIPRADVSRVRSRSAKRGRFTWGGAAV